MRHKEHSYEMQLEWCGNTGSGTATYKSYKRDHNLSAAGKVIVIPGSSDPVFRGDPTRFNPEEMLVGALSSCHMLSFLHLAAVSGIIVTSYQDRATGKMVETDDGGGRFTEAVLHPRVVVKTGADLHVCEQLHEKAHSLCFIANSVNFPVLCRPETVVE